MNRVLLGLSGILLLLAGCDGNRSEVQYRDLPESLSSTLVSYARIRKTQVEQIAAKRHITMAPEFGKFLQLAAQGKWQKAGRCYDKFRFRSYQWESKTRSDPTIANELWEPVHEVGWAYVIFSRWDAGLLQQYANDVLNSIPEGSIYFGGTDEGRFVISAYRNANDTPKVFVITQNALANSFYLNYLEDLYQGQIWTPTEKDSADAFKRLVEGIQSGARRSEGVRVEQGKVQVSDSIGLMEINGILSETIFQRNKENHEFYVEEMYVIPWMRPYLEPHGLIMKLNKEATPLTDAVVSRDAEYWTACTNRLLSSETFLENRPARVTYSKLRCSIAGIYTDRGRFQDAEQAFRQAITLCPDYSEASFRLAQEVYLVRGQFTEAREVVDALRARVPEDGELNKTISGFVAMMDGCEKTANRIKELEGEVGTGRLKPESALELGDLYLKVKQAPKLIALVDAITVSTNVPPQTYLACARLLMQAGEYARIGKVLDEHAILLSDLSVDSLLEMGKMAMAAQRPTLAEDVLREYVGKKPTDWKAWVEYAAVQLGLQKPEDTVESLRRAVVVGAKVASEAIKEDKRFDAIRSRL